MTRGGFAGSALLAGAFLSAAAVWASRDDSTPRARVVIDVPRHRVDVARAGVDEIALLPGVGPSLAARIVSTRAARGAFTSVDELSRVPGVGEATLDALREEVRVSGAAAPAWSGDRGGR